MRIAIDAREIKPTMAGKGRYLSELLLGLSNIDSRDQYYLLTFKKPKLALPNNFHWVLLNSGFGSWMFKLPSLLKKLQVGVFFSPNSYLAALFSSVPTVIVVHDLAVFLEPRAKPSLKIWLIERLTFSLACRRAQHICAVSEFTRQSIIKHFHIKPHKITTTPLAPMSQPSQLVGPKIVAARYHLPPRYILFVATLEPRKNVGGLLKAYAHLPTATKQAIPLLLVGQRGWNAQEIDEKIRAYQLEKNVREIGYVPKEELPTFYQNATLFVYPSWYEGFGLPLLEAMKYNVPVITSNVTSLPEVAGNAALLIDPAKPKSLTLAMQKLLTDGALREKLRAAGKQRVKQFSWQKTATLTLNILENARVKQ